jgi:hypothetical protein
MMNITGKEAPSCMCYNRPDRTAKASKEFKQFVQHCLNKDARHRPSATQLLKEPWFKKFNEDAAYLKTHVIDRLPRGYLGAGSRSRLMRSSSIAMASGASGAPIKKPQSVSTMGDCEWRFGSEPDLYEDIKASGAAGIAQHRFQQTGAVVPIPHASPSPPPTQPAPVPPVVPIFAPQAPSIPPPVVVPARPATPVATAAIPNAGRSPVAGTPNGISVSTTAASHPTAAAPPTPSNQPLHVIPTRAPPLLHSSSSHHLPSLLTSGSTAASTSGAAPPTPSASAGLHFGTSSAMTNGLSRPGVPVASTYIPPTVNPLDYPVSPRANGSGLNFDVPAGGAGGVAAHRFFHTTPVTPSGAANRSPVTFGSAPANNAGGRPSSPGPGHVAGLPAGPPPNTSFHSSGGVAATYLPGPMTGGIRPSYSLPSVSANLTMAPPAYLEEDHQCHHHPVAGALAVSTGASILRFGSGGTIPLPGTSHVGHGAPTISAGHMPLMAPIAPQPPRPASPAGLPAGFIQLNSNAGRRTSYGVTKDVGRFKVAE